MKNTTELIINIKKNLKTDFLSKSQKKYFILMDTEDDDDVSTNKSFATVLNDGFTLRVKFTDTWEDVFK